MIMLTDVLFWEGSPTCHKNLDEGAGSRQGTSSKYQKSYLDLGFLYCICPTRPIITNTETAMLSSGEGCNTNYWDYTVFFVCI